MGDISRYDRCDRFIKEFDEDYKKLMNIDFLQDDKQGLTINESYISVYYFVIINDQVFIGEECIYDPGCLEDDIIECVKNDLNLSEDIIKERLLKADLI